MKEIEKYIKSLKKIAAYKISCKEDIEDVVQNTVLKACINFESFNGNSTLKTWLVAILLNEINEYFRVQKRNNIGKSTEKVPITYQIHTQTDKLNEMFRRIIPQKKMCATATMYYIDGKKVADIAKELNVTESTVRVTLKRARQHILENI